MKIIFLNILKTKKLAVVKMKYLYLFIIFVFSYLVINAQDYPLEIDHYNYIHYDKNKIEFKGKSYENYLNLYKTLNSLALQGKGKINIVHIGDSHLQADYFSGELRKRLQTFIKGGLGSRGFLFPYSVAKTNNPTNYKVKYTGNWERCRNVSKDNPFDLGLAGINVYTYDSIASMSFELNTKDYPQYDFNNIKLFYNTEHCPYTIEIENDGGNKYVYTNYDAGYSEFHFSKYFDSVTIKFIKLDSINEPFIFYGISFENDNQGITYSTIGVNGAEVESYLKCKLFRSQLNTLNPDWIIISLGTNDAYYSKFDSKVFENNYNNLLDWIDEVAPGIPILITTPGDSYRRRRYLNYNMEKAGKVLMDVAEKRDVAVWDFYNIMGGLNAISLWYHSGLTARDKLHFNKYGYLLQGDLLFNAFVKSYDNFIKNNKIN
ncbi:MAG: GDSL-type esterase/lipase family protein [Bacteroidota bacterium]|nr:GDSL-type esterase/lipase family protein [Bacteroidota bacterium]